MAGLAAFQRLAFDDFSVFYTAAERWAAREPLYRAADGHYSFKYLPTTALLLSPLGALPYHWAAGTWAALLGLVAVGLLQRSIEALRSVGYSVPRWGVLLTALVLAPSVARELGHGQLNLVCALLVLVGHTALITGRPTWAGVWLALSVALKPIALLIWPYWVLRRQWQALGVSVILIGGLLLLSLLPYALGSWPELARGWHTSTPGSTQALLHLRDNSSWFGAWATWLGAGTSARWVYLAGAATLLGLAALALPSLRQPVIPARATFELAALLVAWVIANPQGWVYGAAVLPLTVLVLLYDFEKQARAYRWGVGLSLLLVLVHLRRVWEPILGPEVTERYLTSGVHPLALSLWVALVCWRAARLPAC